MPQVIIVSLIDIFAILLIFVIVTTTFKQQLPPSVTIKLPESKTAVQAEKAEEPIVLTISEQEEIFLDQKPVTLDELKTTIQGFVNGKTKRTLALNAVVEKVLSYAGSNTPSASSFLRSMLMLYCCATGQSPAGLKRRLRSSSQRHSPAMAGVSVMPVFTVLSMFSSGAADSSKWMRRLSITGGFSL